MENSTWCIKKPVSYKSVFVASIFLIWATFCSGQFAFSKRYSYGYSALFKMVMLTDYGYLVVGEGRDTIGKYFAPLLTVAYNDYGEVISTRAYGSSELNFYYDSAYDTDVQLNDSTYVVLTSYFEQDNDTNYIAALWLNQMGDTLQTRKYISPYYLEGQLNTDTNFSTALTRSENGDNLYYSAQIFHSSSQNNFMIKKLTAQGEELWTYVDDLEMWYNSCNVINYFNNQLWFVSQASGEQGHYNKLMSLNDDTGVVDYEIEHNASDFIIGGASDMVLDESGYCVTAPAGNVNSIFPFTFKVDFTGEYVWIASPIGDNAPQQQSDHLVKSPDGGYVSCSVKYDEQINPNAPNDPAANNTSEKIWLWKVDSDGNFLWQRFYEYIGFDSGYFYLNNTANDLKATPDGGYIMAGEARANCLEWPCLAGSEFTQQGWLLKVDGCGCLVPGCDEQCVVGMNEQEGEKPSYFKFGPNPARESLNLYTTQQARSANNLRLQLHDMSGRQLRSVALHQWDITYILDIGFLPVGEYILSLFDGNELLQTERLSVVK